MGFDEREIRVLFMPEVHRRLFKGGVDGGASVGRFLTPFAVGSAGVALGVLLVAEELVAWLTDEVYIGAVPLVCLLATIHPSGGAASVAARHTGPQCRRDVVIRGLLQERLGWCEHAVMAMPGLAGA